MKDILLQILTDIGYEDDKQKYADSFLQIVHIKTFERIFHTLPEEKQNQFKNENKDDVEKIKHFLEDNFSRETYDDTLVTVFSEMLDTYLKDIAPHLSEQAIQKLQNSFSSQTS